MTYKCDLDTGQHVYLAESAITDNPSTATLALQGHVMAPLRFVAAAVGAECIGIRRGVLFDH